MFIISRMTQTKPKKSAKSSPAIAAADVDLRTQTGRDALDDAVFKHVSSAPMPVASGDLLEKLGFSPTQIRKSLHRLIDAGRVTSQGVTRATRYTAAAARA